MQNLLQMKLTLYRFKIDLGHFENFKILVEFQYGHVAQRHLTIATEKKNMFVDPSNPETDHTVERALKTGSK